MNVTPTPLPPLRWKRALWITLALCALLSCVDVKFTWYTTHVSSEGKSAFFEAVGVYHGAFTVVTGDAAGEMPPQWDAAFHEPQFRAPLFAGGWSDVWATNLSVLVAVPVLAAVCFGVGALLRWSRRGRPVREPSGIGAKYH
jgi:hypothetical protein